MTELTLNDLKNIRTWLREYVGMASNEFDIYEDEADLMVDKLKKLIKEKEARTDEDP